MTNDEDKFFKRIHGLVGHLRQTLCYMHAWNDSNDQNSKTLNDAKTLRKNVVWFKIGMAD